MLQTFRHPHPFPLECGQSLPELTIAYCTYGTLSTAQDNIVWICHALTANADASDWWKGLIGEESTINPERHFIVCANILGSCYGTTGPLSPDPGTGTSYYHSFPLITIRDMVNAHIILRQYLGIHKIALLAGGSMGGYQVLEWAIAEPEIIRNLFLIATSAAESAWGMAIHTAQRLAIEADNTWTDARASAGSGGLKAARAIGMLSYRNYEMFKLQQTDPDNNKMERFKASSYIIYQGEKLVRRFNAFSYHLLTRSMDSHNIARGRADNAELVLQKMNQPALIMGINSDQLCPVAEQQFMARHLPNAIYEEIDSPYGHDGFLVETGKISDTLKGFLNSAIGE